MDTFSKAVTGFYNNISTSVNVYLTCIFIFVYQVVLDKDFECTCKPQVLDCNLYMALPFCILTIVILWTNKSFVREWRYVCSSQCWPRGKRFCMSLFVHIVKAAVVSILWVTSVLIDGDWWVCCKNNQTEEQSQLACKDKSNITAEEQATITELKSSSRALGFGITMVIVFVAAFLVPINCKAKCCSRSIVDKLILEEVENTLTERLREAVDEDLNKTLDEHMKNRDLEKCLNIASEMIEKFWSDENTRKYQNTQTTRKDEALIPVPPGDPGQRTQGFNNQEEADDQQLRGQRFTRNSDHQNTPETGDRHSEARQEEMELQRLLSLERESSGSPPPQPSQRTEAGVSSDRRQRSKRNDCLTS